jgi:hypothetical protein
MRVAHLESALGELNSIAKRASEAEAGRLRAETQAAELQQQLTAARAEVQPRDVEIGRLRARCGDLESDLATIADELASTSIARARAERLERERDVAVERARAESRLALDERLRALGAERQIDVLRDRLREAEERSMAAAASVPEESNGGWEADVASPVVSLEQPTDFDESVDLMPETVEMEDETAEHDELVGLMPEADVAEDEVVEDVGFVDLMPGSHVVEDETVDGDAVLEDLQGPPGTEDETIEEDGFVDLVQEPDVGEDEVVEEDEVVDLTQEPEVAEDDAGDVVDEPIVWGEPAKRGGFVGWLRRGLDDDASDD